jgi:hypothetical protein
MRFQIRGEAINVLHHVNYPLPNLYVDVGTATTFLNPTYDEACPRVIRLGLGASKVIWEAPF